jgi:UDP-3-O-[3-hydroxymyristoyl] glucosamine N-acyltransferase
MAITAGELALELGLTLKGDAETELRHVAILEKASEGDLCFLNSNKYIQFLAKTQASAVILKPEHVSRCNVTALVADDPYLSYARAAQLLFPRIKHSPGIHPTAVIGQGCHIHKTVTLDPQVIIGDKVVLSEGVSVGGGSIIEDGVHVGAYTCLRPRVTLLSTVKIGEACLIHPGVVIGADGFGFANDQGEWIKIPQVGSVNIGDNVEIGANTTIDRGAIEDTIIGNGVKLDNQIQVAHNVVIGDHTAIAGCTAVAGSTRIGRYCAIGGGAGILGHLHIADHVTITATSFVTQSIDTAGTYSSGVPTDEISRWRKNYARFRQLDSMARRLKILETKIIED